MWHVNSSNSSMTSNISPEKLCGSAILGICFVLGVPGNIAVMVRLVGWLKGDSFTPRLMLSLAVSDLLTLIPLPVLLWAYIRGWIFGIFLCKFFHYMAYCGHYCSILCVILLSVQRYMQVLHPQIWAKLGSKGKKILVGGMWMLSAVFASYVLVQFTLNLKKDGWIRCRPDYRDVTERVATLLWETLTIMVALILLAYFYFCLYKGVNRSAFLNSQTFAKVVTRTVVTFSIIWIPFIINNILQVAKVFLRNDRFVRVTKAGHYITTALTFINSCVNPFLYAFSARALQRQPAGTENA